MLPDLLRALPAALLAGVLPGWFWTRTLLASRDGAERLAFSVALSITLVPTAALVQARLLGTGVTLAIAVTSTLAVFLTGLVAYLRLGAAKGAEEPVAALPPPMGIPALAPLAAALALALVAALGLLPEGWTALTIAPLVLLAGVLHLRGSRHGDVALTDEGTAEHNAPAVAPGVRRLLLPAVLLLVLLRGYLGPLVNGWPFPRGIDRYEHAVMTGMTMETGTTESFMLYPPGFHFLTAVVCRLSGLEPMAVFPALAPALLLLPALACYALAKRVWGWGVGVAAALFAGLVLAGPYLHFAEARYPNFIGTEFLLVVALAALVGTYASPSARGGLLLAVVGSSTVLYHQIAGYGLAVMLALVSLTLLPLLLRRDRRRGLTLLASLALLFALSVAYAWDTYDLGRLILGLLGNSPETGRGGEAVAMAIGTKPTLGILHLLETTTQPVAWLALLGAPLLLVRPTAEPGALARLTLLAWGLLLFVGTLTSYSGFPDRFERDLGMPLAIFAALALVTLLRSVRRGSATPGAASKSLPAAALAAVLLAGALVGLQAVRNLEEASGPSPRPRDRPAPAAVAEAGRWLERHNGGGNIVATPYLGYVPSRGMLAMGGYTGMQSYDAERIRRGRDLPPFGAGPLWDALWVLHHPADGRTRDVLRRNDVRYVVFHKRYPGTDWRPFAERGDLYGVAFENADVVIFEPCEVGARGRSSTGGGTGG